MTLTPYGAIGPLSVDKTYPMGAAAGARVQITEWRFNYSSYVAGGVQYSIAVGSPTLAAIEEKLTKQIWGVDFPLAWAEDGIQAPSDEVKGSAFILARTLWTSNRLLPTRIAASVEEGIAIVYRYGRRELFIEVFNSGEASALVFSGRKPVMSRALHGPRDDSLDSLVFALRGAQIPGKT